MQTKIIKAQENNLSELAEAAKGLAQGKLAAFPTETVYGLGANAFDEDAVKRIYKAKGRPSDNPLIVHISDKAEIYKLAREVNENALKLLEEFTPGPITLIFPKRENISSVVTGGLDTVAVRIPSHPVARELIRLSGVPIAAPSANLSGKPSPTEARHVIEDLDGRVDYIIDGGACSVGVESTIVDMTGNAPVILRPGGITLEDLQRVIPSATADPHITKTLADNEIARCPGMKYKHYAPLADVTVVEGASDKVREKIRELVKSAKADGKRVGVMLRGKEGDDFGADYAVYFGLTDRDYASVLFSSLRGFDEHNIDTVFAELEDNGGMSMAVKNRLYKASGNKIIRV